MENAPHLEASVARELSHLRSLSIYFNAKISPILTSRRKPTIAGTHIKYGVKMRPPVFVNRQKSLTTSQGVVTWDGQSSYAVFLFVISDQ